jgi:hypothetical protein
MDSTNALNTICRLLIKEDVTLLVPEWLNLYAACYEIKTKFIIRTEANTAADITSQEGVHQGCPLGPVLFCLGLRLVHLLVRHGGPEGGGGFGLRAATRNAGKVLDRFHADHDLQGRIQALRMQKQRFRSLDEDTGPDARTEKPDYVDTQSTLRAYMDDQYAIGPPGSLAFECALIGIFSHHHAGLVPNIDQRKLKTGMFIPYKYLQPDRGAPTPVPRCHHLHGHPAARAGGEGAWLDPTQLARGLHQGAPETHAVGGHIHP